MFSMFFGAGNVVFPLALGIYAKDANLYAIMGLLISAVGIPFAGLIAMTLFNGNYQQFFQRIGKVPGFILASLIMAIIGPFGALPRCITLSYATMQIYLPEVSLALFSILSCILIFMLTYKRTAILEILGYVLTPVLLLSLGIIIVKGLIVSPPAPISNHAPISIFFEGLFEGYQTMDLLGAFFFSSVILVYLERDVDITNPKNCWKVIKLALKASSIGATLLALTYIGFSYVAAFNSDVLSGVSKEEIPGRLASLILGPYGGIVVCIAVSLACLTTAMALASVFAEFLHTDIAFGKISYPFALIITLIISFFISTLRFNGIISFLAPILQVCYPALITLTILNILYKLHHFRPVKLPVLLVFLASLVTYLLTLNT